LNLDHALPLEQYPFVEVRVTEEGPDPLRRRRVEQAMEGKPLRLASIKVESANRDANADVVTAALQHFDLKTIDPEDIFQGAWREKYGNDPDMRVLEAFREILLQEARG
jgi:exonuclease SbcD